MERRKSFRKTAFPSPIRVNKRNFVQKPFRGRVAICEISAYPWRRCKFQAIKSISLSFSERRQLRNTFHSHKFRVFCLELFHSCDFSCRNGISTHVPRLIISQADALDFFSFASHAEFSLTQIYFLSTLSSRLLGNLRTAAVIRSWSDFKPSRLTVGK